MLSSGMYNVPVHRPCEGLKLVRTVVPTTCGAPFEASRWPRAEAHATFPQSASRHGAIAMMAVPLGFFHHPSIGAAGGSVAAVRIKMESAANARMA